MRSFIKIILILLFFLVLYFSYTKFDTAKGKDLSQREVSSKEEELAKKKESILNLLFVGDIMTDRNIRKQITKSSSVNDFINTFLPTFKKENQNYDFVVANLEGPITSSPSKTLLKDGSFSKDLIFTLPTSTIFILNELNIKAVSLANNHTDNFYYKGFLETKTFLDEAGIRYFGNPYNSEKDSLSSIICQEDICIALIGYNQFAKDNSKEIFIKEIARLKLDKGVDFIVVMPHWGDEYRLLSNSFQKSLARSFIDAGADLIVGSHPHVVEESEIYQGKYIYYSLGNYIFDQWFSEDVKRGLAINVIFKKSVSGENIERSIEIKKELKVFNGKVEIKYE